MLNQTVKGVRMMGVVVKRSQDRVGNALVLPQIKDLVLKHVHKYGI